MTMALSALDINQLRQHSANGAFGDYYGLLISKGYRYGALALDVVNSQGRAGGVARAFAENIGKMQGSRDSISATDWANISLELMQADFTAREALFNSGTHTVTLPLATIRNYHTEVFARFDLPAHAWTAYVPTVIDVNSVAEGELIWNQMLTAGSNWVLSFVLGVGQTTLSGWDWIVNNQAESALARQWLKAMYLGEDYFSGAFGEWTACRLERHYSRCR